MRRRCRGVRRAAAPGSRRGIRTRRARGREPTRAARASRDAASRRLLAIAPSALRFAWHALGRARRSLAERGGELLLRGREDLEDRRSLIRAKARDDRVVLRLAEQRGDAPVDNLARCARQSVERRRVNHVAQRVAEHPRPPIEIAQRTTARIQYGAAHELLDEARLAADRRREARL